MFVDQRVMTEAPLEVRQAATFSQRSAACLSRSNQR
jgi:hypothetical protein